MVTVPRVPIIIGIIVTFIFPSLFNSLAKVELLIPLFTFFQFYSVFHQDSKVHNSASSLFFFLLIIIRSGHLAKIWWSVCISKSQSCLCISFSRTDSALCIYHLFVWSNFNPLHNFQWITSPTQLCLVFFFLLLLLLLLASWNHILA